VFETKSFSETVEENQHFRIELEKLQKVYKKLELDNNELRQRLSQDRERVTEPPPIQKFTQVTKSLARKVMSELGADSSTNLSKESQIDDPRKINKYVRIHHYLFKTYFNRFLPTGLLSTHQKYQLLCKILRKIPFFKLKR